MSKAGGIAKSVALHVRTVRARDLRIADQFAYAAAPEGPIRESLAATGMRRCVGGLWGRSTCGSLTDSLTRRCASVGELAPDGEIVRGPAGWLDGGLARRAGGDFPVQAVGFGRGLDAQDDRQQLAATPEGV